jgi:L-iditol 2-dehydrogenase
MKAAVYHHEDDDIRIIDMEIPRIGEGELLVKPMAVGLCASELIPGHLKKGGSLGHELAGTVSRVGKGVSTVQEGDRIFVQHHVPCLNCHFCHRGYFTMCEQFREFGFDPTGYAEYTRIKEPHVRIGAIQLAPHVSFEEGCVIEPVSCVLSAAKRAGIKLGDTVLIIGAGFMGLVAIQMVRLFGAGLVIVTDTVDGKLKKAEELKADLVMHATSGDVQKQIRENNEGRLADIVLITAPTIRAVQAAIELTERGGTIIQFGGTGPKETVSIVPYDFLVHELNYFGIYSSSHVDTHQTARLIAQGKLHIRSLITDIYPLKRLKEAIDHKRRTPDSFKVVIHPNVSGGDSL